MLLKQEMMGWQWHQLNQCELVKNAHRSKSNQKQISCDFYRTPLPSPSAQRMANESKIT